MKIRARFQIEGKEEVEKVIEGTDGQAIWKLIISEVCRFFPEHDPSEIKLEKKIPNPVFVARNASGDVLCHVVCEGS